MKRRTTVLIVGIACLSYVGNGLRGGLLGVGWPSVRAGLDLSLDAIGALLIARTIGSLVSSFSTGPAVSRIGIGRWLAISSIAAAAGLLGQADPLHAQLLPEAPQGSLSLRAAHAEGQHPQRQVEATALQEDWAGVRADVPRNAVLPVRSRQH